MLETYKSVAGSTFPTTQLNSEKRGPVEVLCYKGNFSWTKADVIGDWYHRIGRVIQEGAICHIKHFQMVRVRWGGK